MQQHFVAQGEPPLDRATLEIRQPMPGAIVEDDAEHPRPSLDQTPSHRIRDIAERADGIANPRGGRDGDLVLAVHDARDGLDRDTRLAGHVMERRSHLNSAYDNVVIDAIVH